MSDRAGLTTRGATLAAAAPLMVLAGALLGVVELYAVAVADAALVTGCLVWVGLRRWSVSARRVLDPPRVTVGGVVEVDVAVRNEGLRRSPTLVLVDPFDGGAPTVLRLAPMPAGRSDRGRYRAAAPARGRFEIGPLWVTLTDPFGVARRRRRHPGTSTLYVHPAIEALGGLPAAPGDDRGSGGGTRAPAGAGEDFFALRPYREGDDVRRVHWAATARSDELIVRQDEASQRQHLTIGVDLSDGELAGDGLETALSAAASVAATAHRLGLDARLVATSGVDTGWLPPGRLEPLLDALATAGTHPGAGEPLGRQLRGATGTVVVIGGDGPGVTAPAVRAGTVTVVRVDSRGPGAGGRCVHLVGGRPVAPAWDAAVAGATTPGGGRG